MHLLRYMKLSKTSRNHGSHKFCHTNERIMIQISMAEGNTILSAYTKHSPLTCRKFLDIKNWLIILANSLTLYQMTNF